MMDNSRDHDTNDPFAIHASNPDDPGEIELVIVQKGPRGGEHDTVAKPKRGQEPPNR